MCICDVESELIKTYAKLSGKGSVSQSIEGLVKLLLSLIQHENDYSGFTHGNIEEEIADLEITIVILKNIFDGDVINQAKKRKLQIIVNTVNQLKIKDLKRYAE